jgi:hypothetical protein
MSVQQKMDISSAKVKKIIVHKVGNKSRDEGFSLSEQEVKKSKPLSDLLLRHYLAPLARSEKKYKFSHETDIALNAVFQYCEQTLSDASTFRANSKNIAKHLYAASTHFKITGGELIICLFEGILVEGVSVDALGIVRIETKDNYLDVEDKAGALQLVERTGISLEKIQKGALVFSGGQEVLAVDSLSQSTRYWIDSFLKVVPQSTPKACAKIGSEIIKAASLRIEAPSEQVKFASQLSDVIGESESVSLGKIKEVSLDYLSQDSLDKIVAVVQQKAGFEINEELQVDAKSLAKYSKSVISRISVVDGINLLVDSAKVKVRNIEVLKTDGRLRTVLEFDVVGD